MKRSILSYLFAVFLWVLALVSCNNEDILFAPVINSLGIDSQTVTTGTEINILPQIKNGEEADYYWYLNNEFISSERSCTFIADTIGEFTIELNVSNPDGEDTKSAVVTVAFPIREITDKSIAYASALIDYSPAPGQFINQQGLGSVSAAQGTIGGKNGMVSLGAWGGSITVAFDHTIINREGDDFVVFGNAFDGSSEPGIVMVSIDANGNGIADDEWFELKGSGHDLAETFRNYEVTYYNPFGLEDIRWTDNRGNEGVVDYMSDYHTQNHWPEDKADQETMVITGTRIPNRLEINDMGWYVWKSYEWGYTDNFSAEYTEHRGNKLDIDNAIDAEGNPVSLPGIDFIKVYTGCQGKAGWLGENSTEFCGAADLSLLE